jgi:ribose transport system substrate-binding protein
MEKMHMKRIKGQTSIAVTMLAVGAMVLAACGGSTDSAETSDAQTAEETAAAQSPAAEASANCPTPKDAYTIAFVPKALNNPVFEITRQGAEDKAAELGNVTVEWVGPATTDAAAQSQIIDDLVTKGVDGIILSANDASALDPSIDRAVEAGIPVMTWDADAPASKRLTNIGIDQTAAGKLAGELMAKAMPDGGQVAVLTGTPGALNLEQRLAGFKEGIASNSKLEIVSVDPNFDDVQKAVEIVETKINATPDLKGYFFVGMWPFFADLASMPNLKQFVADGGYVNSLDSLEGALNAVDQGYANELVGYSWWGFGQTGVQAMVDYLNTCTPPADPLYTDLYVVDETNIAEYITKQKETGGAF